MSVAPHGVKLPPDTDEHWLAFSRLMNADAPTPELRRERGELRLRLGEVLVAAPAHFAACDQAKIDLLLAEREEITKQAKSVLSEIESWQNTNARHTGAQPRLQGNLQKAQEKLQEFVPVNRTISSLKQIEQNDAEHNELKKAVATARAALNSNAQGIFGTYSPQHELQQQYKELQQREQSIVAFVAELRLPPDQRQKHSSIVWNGESGETFMVQVPYRA